MWYFIFVQLTESEFEEVIHIDISSVETAWIVVASVVFGTIAYILAFRIFFLMMKVCFRCEPLGELDQVFLYEVPENRHIIVATCVFEQFDYMDMKDFLMP